MPRKLNARRFGQHRGDLTRAEIVKRFSDPWEKLYLATYPERLEIELPTERERAVFAETFPEFYGLILSELETKKLQQAARERSMVEPARSVIEMGERNAET